MRRNKSLYDLKLGYYVAFIYFTHEMDRNSTTARHFAQETILFFNFFSFFLDLVYWRLLHLPWVIIVLKRIKTNMSGIKVTVGSRLLAL